MAKKRSRRSRRNFFDRLRPIEFESLESRTFLSASAALIANPLIAYPIGTAVPLIGDIPAGTTSPPGLSATQIRHAYGVDSISFDGVTGLGQGQTIAIITAYDNPKFVDTGTSAFDGSDLHQFDVAMGLPDPPSFQKVDEYGGTDYPSTNPGWANETALDVEWTHALAPDANILLVESYSTSLDDLVSASVQYARQAPGVSVVTMSFAASDAPSETIYDSYFQTPSGHQGVTFLAASGDDGSGGGYPAFSPNVVAVGATSLTLTGSNTIASETGQSTSGGGISAYESKPSYQYGVTQSTTQRTTPDVAFDGNPNTGVSVYDSFNGGSSPWYEIGGTSLSSPAWAGLIAVADQGRAKLGLGTLDGATQTLPRLYSLNTADFHDITSGNNGYDAGTGYDLVTGLGSPVANKLVPDLAGGNSVSGTVFSDTNGNGKLDSGETGISGVSVYVDLYSSTSIKGLDTKVTTSSTGTYTLSDLPGGTYHITEIVPTGDKQTTSEFSVTLGYGSKLTGENIGNSSSTVVTGKGSISGTVFADTNSNGVWNSGETGISGVSVYLDKNDDDKEDTGDVMLTTSSTGAFDFTGLANGTYIVREITPSGKKLTTPTSGDYSVTISNGTTATGKNFGLAGGTTTPPTTGSIAGYVFGDTNDDGKWESTEKGVAGVVVYIDKNDDGKEDTGDVVLTTSSTGAFDFTNLANGTYVIREVIPTGKKISTPTSDSYTVTITNGYNATGKNFGQA